MLEQTRPKPGAQIASRGRRSDGSSFISGQMRMRRIIGFAGLVLVLGFLASYVWPVTSAMRLASALEASDSAAIASHVDFESVRRNLARDAARAALDQGGQREFKPGERDAAITKASVDMRPLIDQLFTDDAIVAFLKSGRVERPGGAAAVALDPRLPTFAALAKSGVIRLLLASDPEEFSKFVIVADIPMDPLSRYGLIFHRHGFSWRLAELDLPRALRYQLAGEIAGKTKP